MEDDSNDPLGERCFSEVTGELNTVIGRFIDKNISFSPDPARFASYQTLLSQHIAEVYAKPVINPDALTYVDKGHFARDYATVMLFNFLNLDSFVNVDVEKRAIFLPECLTARRKCAADEHDRYISCAHCGACSIDWLLKEAAKYGYLDKNAFIVAGGSGIPVIIRQHKIEALIGLACYNEVYAFLELYKEADEAPPAQMIMLSKWGCRNTQFSQHHAIEVLETIKQHEKGAS